MRWLIGAFIAVGLSNAAQGQALKFAPTETVIAPGSASRFDGQTVDPANTYFRTFVPSANGPYEQYIRLSDFYATLPIGPVGPAGANGPAGPQGPAGPPGAATATSSAALVGIANRLTRTIDRFREGIALAGAINILPPNPGDRFTVSFGGAGYDGAAAGSVAIAARIDESALAYVGYSRGPTQSLVKGGVGFSFR